MPAIEPSDAHDPPVLHLDRPRWRERIPKGPPQTLRLEGEEPLERNDLVTILEALAEHGHRAIVPTDLPGLGEDQHIRPYAPFDVRFEVRFPSSDPVVFAAHSTGTLKDVEAGLRNLAAFAYPFDLRIPVDRHTVAGLPATLAHLFGTYSPSRVLLSWQTGKDEARWRDFAEALLAYDATVPRPQPRLVVSGLHGLALPVERLEEVELVVEGGAGDALAIPPHQEADAPDLDTLSKRRIWLALPAEARPGHRHDPRDRLVGATAAVSIRSEHEVYAVIRPLQPGVPALATSRWHGLYIAGRFEDPQLRTRFAALARLVHGRVQQEAEVDLARLRAIAHVLRRGMKPSRDDEPVAWRDEGE